MQIRTPLLVEPIPAFNDNYIWSVTNGHFAILVDPGDATPALEYLVRKGLELAAILVTHHHGDHIGGIADLLQDHPVPVYGPAIEPIPALTHRVNGGDAVFIPHLELKLEVMDIPGHTRGHVAYYGANMLFCGDTLFACGCGRVFEGTPLQMHSSLQKLAALPDETLVYCAHEYTLANIRFARVVEPGNSKLAEREQEEQNRRNRNLPTLPTTIGREKATNPFLRCSAPGVVQAASRHSASSGGTIAETSTADVFAAIREWKNKF